MNWEQIDSHSKRAWIPGLGWLVKVSEDVYTRLDVDDPYGYEWRIGLTFVPDPHKTWELEVDECPTTSNTGGP